MAALDSEPLAGRLCLVLGSSGFLGRWLVRALLERDARVLCQVRERRRLPTELAAHIESRGQVLEADLTLPGSGAALVRCQQPDVVFNLLGYGVAKDERATAGYKRLNAELPEELAAALLKQAPKKNGERQDQPVSGLVRLLHVGSALEYGSELDSLDERATCRPTTTYGRSKLSATQALDRARAAGLACLTLRAFTVFGLGERSGRLFPTLLQTRHGSARIPLSSGSQKRDWVYVEDLARALCELAAKDPTEVRARTAPYDAPALNLACGTLHSVREVSQLFAKAFAIGADKLGFGDIPGLADEMFHPTVPTARLVAALGWALPNDPRDAFRRMRAHLTAGIEA